MKKLLAMMGVAGLVVSTSAVLVSCGGGNDTTENDNNVVKMNLEDWIGEGRTNAAPAKFWIDEDKFKDGILVMNDSEVAEMLYLNVLNAKPTDKAKELFTTREIAKKLNVTELTKKLNGLTKDTFDEELKKQTTTIFEGVDVIVLEEFVTDMGTEVVGKEPTIEVTINKGTTKMGPNFKLEKAEVENPTLSFFYQA